MEKELRFRREAIGELIRSRGLTQAQFAKMLGTSRALAFIWAQGECAPQAGTLCKICNVFGLSIDFFFTIQEYTNTTRDTAQAGVK